MAALRAFLDLLRRILWGVTVGWVGAWRAIIGRMLSLLRRWHDRRGMTKRERRAAPEHCVPLRHPAHQQPDPLLYSQSYLMGLGLAVTWDNPDIELRLNGVPVPSAELAPDTTYDVVTRVWNSSTKAPVVGLPVYVSYVDAGIGGRPLPVASTKVDLGVKGGPQHPAFASVPWTTPSTPGNYGLLVTVDWLDDANPRNNVGQENTLVAVAHSPTEFGFRLRNDREDPQMFRWEIDTYTPPEREPFGADVSTDRHSRDRFPLPEGWRVEVTPQHPQLPPAADTNVRVVVTAPEGWRGRQAVNVNAFAGEQLAGGMTLIVDGPGS